MKRRMVLLSVLLVMISILSMGTYAYYQAVSSHRNVITAGKLKMELVEKGSVSHTKKEALVIMPGDVIDKEVRVKNIGGHAMYVRVELIPTVVDSKLDAKKCVRVNINDRDWVEDGGYYYYKKELKPGETTPELFTKVTFVGKEVTNEYLGKRFQLDIDGFAVQSEHNGEDPLKAHGWPEE